MTTPNSPKPWREMTRGERLRLVLFALTPVVGLRLGLEGLSFLAIARDFNGAASAETGKREYVFRMGRYPWSVHSRTELNSMGFPDIEFDRVPAGDCFHVLMVGDSYTFGDGVDGSASYASLLRQRLTKQAGSRCMRLFNVGERASSIEQQLRNFRKVQPLLRPDAVVLSQYQNDLTDLTKTWFASQAGRDSTATGETWKPRFRLPAVESSLVRFLSYRLIAVATMGSIKYDLLSRWSVLAGDTVPDHAKALLTLYEAVFDSLVTEVRASGATFATVIIPSKLDVLAGRSPEEPYFRGLATARQVPVLSLFLAFDSTRSPYPFLLYDGHLNEEGNRFVAARIEQWFLDRKVTPFPSLSGAAAP